MRFLQGTGKPFAPALAAMGALCAQTATAQNTSSISSPTVTAGDRSVEYRFGWVPGEDGLDDSFAHRFDYGFSLNSRSSLKLNARFEEKPGSDLRFDNFNVEYLMELTPETAKVWQSGIRFDARISNGPDSERIGIDWLNRWRLTDRVQARGMLIATRSFGGNADDAIAFEARSSLSVKLNGDYDLAVLGFFDLGTSDNFTLDDQTRQVGPTISGPLGNGWSWTAGNLFGLSDDAPDNDVRLWVSKDF